MADENIFCLSFYRDEMRVWIRCAPLMSELSLTVPQKTASQVYQLEVLFQATDEHGLPVGRAHQLYETEIIIEETGFSQEAYGRVRLPFRLKPELLKACYLRLIPCTISLADKTKRDQPN